jgi:hypothetical protein
MGRKHGGGGGGGVSNIHFNIFDAETEHKVGILINKDELCRIWARVE